MTCLQNRTYRQNLHLLLLLGKNFYFFIQKKIVPNRVFILPKNSNHIHLIVGEYSTFIVLFIVRIYTSENFQIKV